MVSLPSCRRLGIFVLAVALCCLALPARTHAQEKKASTADLIRFTWTLTPDDPFSKENAVDAKLPEQVRGQTFYLTIHGTPKAGFHTYPITLHTAAQDENGLSKLTYDQSKTFTPLPPVLESEPEEVDEEGLGFVFEHKKPFSWSQEILVNPEAQPGPTDLRVRIRTQVCDDKHCTWVERDLTVPVTISAKPAAALSDEVQRRATTSPTINTPPPPKPVQASSDWLSFIGFAAFAGAISLFTPCVFPMIPITVSFFLKQSEKKQSSPLTMAAIYCGTIVFVLTVGGLLMMTVLQRVSQHWATNLLLGGLFVVFGLSLLGMYEITMPSFLINLSSARQDQGGVLGTVFMALTFTLVSFTCVAPFYGGLAASVASAQTVSVYVKLVCAALAYSLTFATPFFVLALFPGLMRALPRSGGWMNTIKVVMGFLELAAAIGFLRGAEIVWTHVQPRILTFDVSIGLYIALSLTCGLYLLNLFRLPHDYEPAQMLSVPRLLFALAFIGLALYLTPALFKQPNGTSQRPGGIIYEWIESFLLTDNAQPTGALGDGNAKSTSELTWSADLASSLAKAKKEKKLIFIDFTGVTCKNCRINENTVFSQTAVRDLMNRYVLVQLYTDTIPAYVQSPTTAPANAQFQLDKFQDVQLPLYVIVQPDGDSFQTVDKYTEGKINDVAGFKAFLTRNATAK